MEPHGSNCGWFRARTIARFELALGFLAIFSLGPMTPMDAGPLG
jgi:hypothetical protein